MDVDVDWVYTDNWAWLFRSKLVGVRNTGRGEEGRSTVLLMEGFDVPEILVAVRVDVVVEFVPEGEGC
jgi:hypothetical protein